MGTGPRHRSSHSMPRVGFRELESRSADLTHPSRERSVRPRRRAKWDDHLERSGLARPAALRVCSGESWNNSPEQLVTLSEAKDLLSSLRPGSRSFASLRTTIPLGEARHTRSSIFISPPFQELRNCFSTNPAS